jgi:hypothetical protein
MRCVSTINAKTAKEKYHLMHEGWLGDSSECQIFIYLFRFIIEKQRDDLSP